MAYKRNIIVFLFSLFVLLSAPGIAQAAVYYVSTSGSDSGNGSEGSPFRTVAHAVNVMEAGDTTYVKGGVYNESKSAWFKKSGTASAPIRLLAAPGESPVIDYGSTPGPGGGRIFIGTKGTLANGAPPTGHIQIQGLEIRNGVTGIMMFNAHDLVISQNWIRDAKVQGILGNGKNILFDGNTISGAGKFEACAAGALTKGGTSVCNQDHGMYITGSNWVITNNLISNNLFSGIQVAGYPWCEKNETCYGGGAKEKTDPSFAGATNFVIANNTIINNGGPGVILWQPAAGNNKIVNNIFYNNGLQHNGSTPHISLYGTSGGNVISDNFFSGGTALGGKAGWQSLYTGSGNIMNGGPPGFINSAGGNFNLQPGAAAAGKGPGSEYDIPIPPMFLPPIPTQASLAALAKQLAPSTSFPAGLPPAVKPPTSFPSSGLAVAKPSKPFPSSGLSTVNPHASSFTPGTRPSSSSSNLPFSRVSSGSSGAIPADCPNRRFY